MRRKGKSAGGSTFSELSVFNSYVKMPSRTGCPIVSPLGSAGPAGQTNVAVFWRLLRALHRGGDVSQDSQLASGARGARLAFLLSPHLPQTPKSHPGPPPTCLGGRPAPPPAERGGGGGGRRQGAQRAGAGGAVRVAGDAGEGAAARAGKRVTPRGMSSVGAGGLSSDKPLGLQ